MDQLPVGRRARIGMPIWMWILALPFIAFGAAVWLVFMATVSLLTALVVGVA